MSKSYAPKDAARKRRGRTRRKATSKVIAEKARDKHQQTRPRVMAERNLPAIAVWEVGDAKVPRYSSARHDARAC